MKVVFPTETIGLDAMPAGDDWYTQWREMPEDERPPFRTYTTRQVRNDVHEVDIDMVAHDVLGPASAWISRAAVGDEVLILAPTTAHSGVSYGIDFVPPARTDKLLLAGDETAAPAIAVILEQLPPEATGVVVLELPHRSDAAYLPHHPGFEYRVSARGDGERHAHLVSAVQEAAASLVPAGRGAEVEEVDIDAGILWEVPRTAKGGAALKSAPLYSWLAGESSAIKSLRRHLVAEQGGRSTRGRLHGLLAAGARRELTSVSGAPRARARAAGRGRARAATAPRRSRRRRGNRHPFRSARRR